MCFDQTPLGGAHNDTPTDDLGFQLEQIAEQADVLSERACRDGAGELTFDLARLIASLARTLALKEVGAA